jgi:hypothetical protein
MAMLKRTFFFFILCFSSHFISAQTEDLGSWMTFSVDKGIFGKLDFNFDQELRLKDNISDVNLLYTNLGISYKFNKYFRLATVYRMIDKHKGDNTYGIRNRFYTDLIFKYKIGKFTLGYRARFQGEWRKSGYYSDLGNVPEVFLRNLFKVSYKLGEKWSPYVATELRWQIQNPRLPWGNGFDRTRFYVGTSYEINKTLSAGTYFLLQKEWNVNDPQTLYIIGLEFGVSLD